MKVVYALRKKKAIGLSFLSELLIPHDFFEI